MGVIGKDIPHESARGHVTGQSLFVDGGRMALNYTVPVKE